MLAMRELSFKKLFFLLLVLIYSVSVCEAQKYKRSTRNPERSLFGKTLGTKEVKYRESPSVVRAKRKQAKNQAKLDKEYKEYVKDSRKRAVKIQSPEVQDRMIENRKEADLKYREKARKTKKNSGNKDRKYRYLAIRKDN